MSDAIEGYVLDSLQELTVISEKEGCKITVVKDAFDSTLFVKKQFDANSNIDIYKSLMEVEHSALPKIYHVIKLESGFVVVEEYISGSTLKSAIKNYSFSAEDVSDIAIQLCDALDVLHKMTPPIIHRDINPSNIMLMADGRVKLIDFDAAKEYKARSTKDTTTLGTEAYAAPEQFGYTKTDTKTDIYCLGATMYYMLIGKQYIEGSLIPSGKIFEIIQKCLEFDPANRYPDAEALRKDLVKLKKPAVN
jgi:serine/threonine protein kinase